MPRRATSTSYGAENGNKGGVGKKGRSGDLPDTMKARFRLLAQRAKTLKNIESILDDPDHPKFDRMLDTVLERGFGKVPQAVEQKHEGDITVRVVRDEAGE